MGRSPVAKEPDWTPPGRWGRDVFVDGAPAAPDAHVKPNSSGRMQPYDDLGQYASPRDGGWSGTGRQGRGKSLLALGEQAVGADLPPEDSFRGKAKRESLLFMEPMALEENLDEQQAREYLKQAGADHRARPKARGVEYDEEGNPIGEEGLEEPAALLDPVDWISGGAAAHKLWRKGGEIMLGKTLRVAPFGNRTGHELGTWPHYHRAVPDPRRPGHSIRNQGDRRHRPWQKNDEDTSWKDRF